MKKKTGWRKSHREKLRNLYYSPNIIIMIKIKRTSWKGHVVCMGKNKNAYKILVGKARRNNITKKAKM
jgi:hypothetical protein